MDSRIRIGKLELGDPLLAQKRNRHDQGRERTDQRQRDHEAAEGIVDERAVEPKRRAGRWNACRNQREAQERDGDLVDQQGRSLAPEGAEHQQGQGADAQDQFGKEQREGIAGGHRQSCAAERAAVLPAGIETLFTMPSTVAIDASRIGAGCTP